MATLEELTERIRRAATSDLASSIKLDLRGEGFVHIDGPAVSNDDKPADLVVTDPLQAGVMALAATFILTRPSGTD